MILKDGIVWKNIKPSRSQQRYNLCMDKKRNYSFYKVGRQYKFKVSEVDAWVESGQSVEADKNNTVEEKQDGSGK